MAPHDALRTPSWVTRRGCKVGRSINDIAALLGLLGFIFGIPFLVLLIRYLNLPIEPLRILPTADDVRLTPDQTAALEELKNLGFVPVNCG